MRNSVAGNSNVFYTKERNDHDRYLIVCPLVFLAGLRDSIAGGGGLISLPRISDRRGSGPIWLLEPIK